MTRFRLFLSPIAVATLAVATHCAYAQMPRELTCRSVTIVAPFPAGSTTDTIARALAGRLAAELDRPVVVDNKPGAEGQIAALDVMRSPPNGCRLLFATSGNLSVAPQLRAIPPYDPRTDFTPIADIGRYTYVLYLRARFPADTFAEFVAAVKAAPERYTYATGSNTNYLAFGYVNQLAGLDLRRIPYKGEPPAIIGMLGGEVDAIIATTFGVPFVRDGKLKALAVMSSERSSVLPNVPTFAEVGLKNFDIIPWAGLVGPAKMERATTLLLGQVANRALVHPEVHATATTAGFLLTQSTPERFAALIRDQHVAYGRKIKELGLTTE